VLSSSQKFTFFGADSSPLDSSLLQEITKLGTASSRGVRLKERERDFFPCRDAGAGAGADLPALASSQRVLAGGAIPVRAGLRHDVGGGGDRAGLRFALG
jgi:hypothetical protein